MAGAKPPGELTVGDLLEHSQQEGTIFIITDVKPFIQAFVQALAAGGTNDNVEVDALQSPKNKIYHVMGVELLNDINFQLTYAEKELIGPKAGGLITIRDAPRGSPFPLDQYIHVIGPDATEVNNDAVNTVASTVNFVGRSLTIRKTTRDPEQVTATKLWTG